MLSDIVDFMRSRGVDSVDLFEVFKQSELLMTPEQFELATKGMVFRESKNAKEMAYAVMVDLRNRQEVAKEHNVTESNISTLVNKIIHNLDEQLKKNGLYRKTYIFKEEFQPFMDKIEKDYLNQDVE